MTRGIRANKLVSRGRAWHGRPCAACCGLTANWPRAAPGWPARRARRPARTVKQLFVHLIMRLTFSLTDYKAVSVRP